MAEEQKKLLVIDDSATFREAITMAGEDYGWEVYAGDVLDGIRDWLAENRPDVVLFDWQLPGQQRRKYAELLQEHRLTEHTLLLSGAMDEARRQFVAEYGLAGARLKPFDLGRFEEEIELPPRKTGLLQDRLINKLSGRSVIQGFRKSGRQAFSNDQLVEMVDKVSLTTDILDRNLDILWSNQSAKKEPLTEEQRLIAKWLQVEIEEKQTGNVVRRLDWDREKGRFLESRLYPIGHDLYGLERDWRDEGEQPHDREFLNLEGDKDLTLEKWLRAVARLLAQRYAISRLRVYKVTPLPHTEGLEREHTPLMAPKFQSGGGIEPNTEVWLRGGFDPRCFPHIEDALKSKGVSAPRWVRDLVDRDPSICKDIARVRYGQVGTFRVLFPVRDQNGQIVALLAMDRRLDHIKELDGFDKKVVELARRMASDEARVLTKKQWSLMQGLVEDIGERVDTWLREDEDRRAADWHNAISKVLIDIFAATTNSPEMTYEGISQVCAGLSRAWNEEKISGVIQGATPWPQQNGKGESISDWYIALILDDTHWQVVAGWGNAYEIYRQQGEQMQGPAPRIVATEKAWKGVMIQDFQTWSKETKHLSHDGSLSEVGKTIGSWLAVPMQVEGRIRATMVVHSPHAHYFTAFHTRLLEDAAQRLLPLLTAALRETRARSAFTAAVMHEVKNDSHTALMLLALIQKSIDQGGEIKGMAEYLIEIRHHLEGLNALGQDSLDIFRTGAKGDAQEWKDDERDITTTLGNLLENATRSWRILYQETEFESNLPNDHVEGFITPADEKRARVGWISEAHPPEGGDGGCASLIHPTAPSGLLFHSKELAARKIRIPRNLDFKRVLRVLLHNAFRHGEEWVHIAVELQNGIDTDKQQLELTIRNGAYEDVIAGLSENAGSAMGSNPGSSPLTRGRMGLTVARQLTLEAGGFLSELQYQKKQEDWGEVTIALHWPIKVIA
uniref:CheY chemotaxis protein or a CheY-like REC (Receiver) domain n=1 Tax=Candidatus Kentrum sp. LPFa TaxID=2126335 RepID=A0A450WP12_9GAMM|nr:MAG: CheY chemotaxis protein or a CheY-like REC (receiver) domain [Candidatus Kentron sp. LPFa]